MKSEAPSTTEAQKRLDTAIGELQKEVALLGDLHTKLATFLATHEAVGKVKH